MNESHTQIEQKENERKKESEKRERMLYMR